MTGSLVRGLLTGVVVGISTRHLDHYDNHVDHGTLLLIDHSREQSSARYSDLTCRTVSILIVAFEQRLNRARQ